MAVSSPLEKATISKLDTDVLSISEPLLNRSANTLDCTISSAYAATDKGDVSNASIRSNETIVIHFFTIISPLELFLLHNLNNIISHFIHIVEMYHD